MVVFLGAVGTHQFVSEKRGGVFVLPFVIDSIRFDLIRLHSWELTRRQNDTTRKRVPCCFVTWLVLLSVDDVRQIYT
jgi:hypothetical protein